MSQLGPRPTWMHPLPEDPPPLEESFDACVTATQHHGVPTHLCRQCLTEEMEARIIAAARLAQTGTTPAPEAFGQIYFEHPGCVGGEETIKLFLPHGLKTMLTGMPPPGFGAYSYPEVLDTTLKAGFWFWDAAITTPVRAIAARLFHDWFRDGHYPWPQPDWQPDDLMGPGDDILQLCIACLIDPADLIAQLGTLTTPQADDALSAAGGFTTEPPFYLSPETGSDTPRYKPACDAITATMEARDAQAFLHYVTPDWLQQAFFRNEAAHPALAARLSKLENYYQIQTVETVKAAAQDMLEIWPDLPPV